MTDRFGRRIEYLRISVTDRCNLRCTYCMPAEGVPPLSHGEILTFDEIERMVHIAARLGVTRVRLTGGEPLVRRDFASLVRQLKSVSALQFIGITTNATLLARQAEELYRAGVQGVNISLDTADRQRYKALTRRDSWQAAWEGLQAALALPFPSVKVNTVLSPDSTEADWLGVTALARELPVDVRLIEWMPLFGQAAPAVTAETALRTIEGHFGAATGLPCGRQDNGPARYYRLPGFHGRLGLIPALSHRFCDRCNRIRITAAGDCKLCLFYDTGLGLRGLLRGGASDEEITDALNRAVLDKPRHHKGHPQTNPGDTLPRPPGMASIGG